MAISSRSYEHGNIVPPAQLNIPSLSIFWQPPKLSVTSVTESQVASAILENRQDEWLANYFRDLWMSEATGATFSATAIMHEWRHFDDLILTSWGNHLFAQHFFAVVQNLKLWRRLQNSSNRHIRVPVHEDDFPEFKDTIRVAKKATSECIEAAKTGKYSAELLAYWVQDQWVWATRDSKDQMDRYRNETRSSIPETRLLEYIYALGAKWKAPNEEFIEIMYELLLGCLAHPLQPDSLFSNCLDVLRLHDTSWSLAKEMLRKVVFPSLELTAQMGIPVFQEWFFANLRLMIDENGEYLAELDKKALIDIADDFIDVKRRLAKAIDGENSVYRQFRDYWYSMQHKEPDRPGPQMYAYYPANEGFVYLGKPFEIVNDFLYIHSGTASPRILKRFGAPESRQGVMANTILIHSLPNMNVDVDAMLSDKWTSFARDIVGCTLLTSGWSARNPIHAYWTAVVAQKAGVTIEAKILNKAS